MEINHYEKIKLSQLRRIIKEEVSRLISEAGASSSGLDVPDFESYTHATSWLAQNGDAISNLDDDAKADVREKFIEKASVYFTRRGTAQQWDLKFKAPSQPLGTRPPEYYGSRSRHGDGEPGGSPVYRDQLRPSARHLK